MQEIPTTVQATLEWITRSLAALDYGEVQVTLTKHQGRIVKIRKAIDEHEKPEK
jgi:hypothetical protein